MNKILIINPFGIGDVLFTTPVIANLRRAYPQARIVYLGNARTVGFLKDHPEIARVFVYERDEFHAVYRRNLLAFAAKWLDFLKEIRDERFDIAFDFSMNSLYGFLCQAAGIPKRIGFDHRGRGRFLTDKTPLVGYEGKHVVEHYLDFLEAQGIPVVERNMSFPITGEDRVWAGQWMAANNIKEGSSCIAVVPGGGASWGAAARFKRWPAEKYADLVDKIVEKYPSEIILMGDSKEKELCTGILRSGRKRVHSALGQTSLGQMAALLQQCRLAIVNDGGPLHIAVACGVRTVSIFGPVDPVVYGPYLPTGRQAHQDYHTVVQKGLACQPCYRRFRMASCGHISCLNDLSVEDVFRKVSIP